MQFNMQFSVHSGLCLGLQTDMYVTPVCYIQVTPRLHTYMLHTYVLRPLPASRATAAAPVCYTWIAAIHRSYQNPARHTLLLVQQPRPRSDATIVHTIIGTHSVQGAHMWAAKKCMCATMHNAACMTCA